jgi:hypothetical protein
MISSEFLKLVSDKSAVCSNVRRVSFSYKSMSLARKETRFSHYGKDS